jgi:hypothetical protein
MKSRVIVRRAQVLRWFLMASAATAEQARRKTKNNPMSEREVINDRVIETMEVPQHEDTDKVEVVVTPADGTTPTVVTIDEPAPVEEAPAPVEEVVAPAPAEEAPVLVEEPVPAVTAPTEEVLPTNE